MTSIEYDVSPGQPRTWKFEQDEQGQTIVVPIWDDDPAGWSEPPWAAKFTDLREDPELGRARRAGLGGALW
jgi:hypothetical protein